MKNKIYISAIVSFIILNNKLFAQPHYEYAYSMGSVASEFVNDLTIDKDGNFYLSGEFYEEFDFDFSPYTTTLTSNGSNDGFFCKYNKYGELIWAKNVGGNQYDGINKMAVDDNGNVYIAGYFAGTADLDPSLLEFNVTSAGNYDVFFAKYNSDGELIWGKSLGGPDDDFCVGIMPDADGNVYLAGGFENTCNFNPYTFGGYEVPSSGEYDGYIAKYDSNGNFVWVNTFGTFGLDYATDLKVDEAGKIYICGAFEGFVPFGGGFNLTAAGGLYDETDPFFAKYNSDGTIYWAKSIYGDPGANAYNPNYAIALDVDGDGNVIVTGNFWQTADFDPDETATATLTTVGAADTYLAKYDNNGNYLWATHWCGLTYENSNDVAVDAQGSIYVIGLFFESSTADFDPTGDTLHLESEGDNDIYLTKYSSAGDMQWAFNAGGTNADYGIALEVDNSYNIYCGGWFWSPIADFWPGDGDATISHVDAAGEDIWLAKYSQPDIDTASFVYSPQHAQLNVYPNPASDIINVQIPDELKSAQIKLLNAQGNILKTIPSQNNPLVQINIKNYPEGIYFLQISNDEKNYFSKFIITH